MDTFLPLREDLIKFYKEHSKIIDITSKFLLGIFIYLKIFSIGMYSESFAGLTTGINFFIIIIVLSFLFAILPINASYTIMSFVTFFCLSKYPEIALIVFSILMCFLLFYCIVAPKESIFILATLLAFYFKVPFVVPIIAGLYFSITTLVPIIIGTYLWYLKGLVKSTIDGYSTSELDISGLFENFVLLYKEITVKTFSDSTWIFFAFTMVLILLVVNFISKMDIVRNMDTAILAGGIVALVGLSLVTLLFSLNISFLYILFSSIFSTAIAYIIRFFDIVLDYDNVTRVKFRDEENYYFVTIIPKILMDKNTNKSKSEK